MDDLDEGAKVNYCRFPCVPTRVADSMALDLQRAFPEASGFSVRNLKNMRRFADAWPDGAIVQRTVARLPWGSWNCDASW